MEMEHLYVRIADVLTESYVGHFCFTLIVNSKLQSILAPTYGINAIVKRISTSIFVNHNAQYVGAAISNI